MGCVAGEADVFAAGERSELRRLLEREGSRCCFELSLPMIAFDMSCAWPVVPPVPERLRECAEDLDMLLGCEGELEVEAEVEVGCATALVRLAEGGAGVAFGIVVGRTCALSRRLN